MKLIYLTDSLPYGKSEAFVIPELRELLRRGHQVDLYPIKPRRESEVIHDGIDDLLARSHHEPLVSGRVAAGAIRYLVRHPVRSARALAVAARSRNVTVGFKNLAVMPKAWWLAGRVERGDVDHVHAHWAAHTATVGLLVSRLTGVPWSFTAHRWDIAERNLLDVKVADARFARAIDVHGARELAQNARADFADIDIIHMGVDVAPAEAEVARRDGAGSRPPTQAGDFPIVVAANLEPKKGHEYLFQAVAMLRKRGSSGVRVDVVGNGQREGELRQQVQDLGIAGVVRFVGWIPHDQLLRRLRDREWGAMVLPSIVARDGQTEGIPVALIEALAAGVPAVSTTVGGIPELLEGGAGLIVEPGNAAALADALDMVAGDLDLRESLKAKGLDRVRQQFSIVRIVDELETRFGAVEPSRPLVHD